MYPEFMTDLQLMEEFQRELDAAFSEHSVLVLALELIRRRIMGVA